LNILYKPENINDFITIEPMLKKLRKLKVDRYEIDENYIQKLEENHP
jgi:hypothetical protein